MNHKKNLIKSATRQKVEEVWEKPATRKLKKDPRLVRAFTEVLNEIWSKPWLGNATTDQLICELRTRCQMNGTASYRTADDR